jgi:hypothetical protein
MRGRLGQGLVKLRPRKLAFEMTFDAQLGPASQFFVERGSRVSGLQTQRIAAKIEAVAPFMLGEEIFVAKNAQGVFLIHATGVVQVGLVRKGSIGSLHAGEDRKCR